MQPAIDRLLAIYEAAMAAPPGADDASGAAARHVSRIARPLKEAYGLGVHLQKMTTDLALARSAFDAASERIRALESSATVLESSAGVLTQELRAREQELTGARERERLLREQVVAVQSVATLRIRDAVLRVPIVGPVLHTGARRLAQLLRS